MLNANLAGTVFVVLFVGSIVLLGDLVGSFADRDQQFVTLFADSTKRAGFIGGSVLLLLAGLTFIWFAHALSCETGSRRAAMMITGSATAAGMIVAAVAFATVPLSLSFGAVFDDPGLEAGQAVLPQFGYVAFGLGAMLPAALFIVIAARTPNLLPRWLAAISYPIAVLVALTAFLFLPMFLFVAWMIAATWASARSGGDGH